MRRYVWIAMAVLAAAVAASYMARPHAHVRQIRIVGSSTVYPFITAAAEMFGLNGKFPTPIVESTGTGGGFKIFCGGAAADTPDINDASRRMLPSEIALCRTNHVGPVTEIALGYDGITLSSSIDAPAFHLTIPQLFLALARKVPHGGGLIDNPYTQWNQIAPGLPAVPIQVYGPPPVSGTRDAFAELALEKGCDTFPQYAAAYAEPTARQYACRSLREDGRFVEAGENGNLVIEKLRANPGALGIVGYSFVEENPDKVRAGTIGGVAPTAENIGGGAYPLSRKLYIYVKNAHAETVPGLVEFVREVTSEAAMGPDGYFSERGLLPLPQPQREHARESAELLLSVSRGP